MLELRGIQVWLTYCATNLHPPVEGPHANACEETGTAVVTVTSRKIARYMIHVRCNRHVSANCEIWVKSPTGKSRTKALSHRLTSQRSNYRFANHSSGLRFSMAKSPTFSGAMGTVIIKISEDGKDKRLRFTFRFEKDSPEIDNDSSDSDYMPTQRSRGHEDQLGTIPIGARYGRPPKHARLNQQAVQSPIRIKMSSSPCVHPPTPEGTVNAVSRPLTDSPEKNPSQAAGFRAEETQINDTSAQESNNRNIECHKTMPTIEAQSSQQSVKTKTLEHVQKQLKELTESLYAGTTQDPDFLSVIEGSLSALLSQPKK